MKRSSQLVYPNPWKQSKISINPLHAMCSRLCSFPPAMARHFIENFSDKDDVFLDSFSGKGTAPLEAALLGRQSFGNDISPEAYVLTYAKLNPIKWEKYEKKVLALESDMGFIKSINKIDKNIKIFYNPSTLKQILEIKELLIDDHKKDAMFIKGVMLGILHGSTNVSLSLRCSHSYSMSPNYVQNYAKEHGLIRPKRDVIKSLLAKGQQLLKNNEINFNGTAFNSDSRNIPLKDDFVDIAVLSPPYLRVQTYAYDNWLRLWFLGHDYKEVSKKIMQSGSLLVYSQFMKESITELYRVLKPGANCFIVVGDVNTYKSHGPVKKIKIAEILNEISKEIGFKSKNIIVDKIPKYKKSMLTSSSCGVKTERILHITK